ncbi:MAG: type I-B CRISPR-associated protein Cas7/Cst2/DevR [Clostridia bacterium]|nr:type I-B CRISPR-associated protein Cas7/Cst2/DevR [Clostridia bacterium]
MKNKGLTITLIIDANSANYGEGFGNITTLKKLTRGDGNSYSYISRQALRYNIVEQLGYDNTPVKENGKGSKKVVQFDPNATIADYPEIDLFGYMKTREGGADTRNAVVRLSNAISLEEYNSDLDYLTNAGLAKRGGLGNSIAQSEIHKSLYSYTVTIDLDKIGVDGEIDLPEEVKKKRVKELLKTIEFLYRDIKGRRENLSPIFVIGGIYNRKNPYFENRIELDKTMLKTSIITEILNSDEDIKNNTMVGYLEGSLSNNDMIKEELKPIKIHEFFEKLINKIEEEC